MSYKKTCSKFDLVTVKRIVKLNLVFAQKFKWFNIFSLNLLVVTLLLSANSEPFPAQAIACTPVFGLFPSPGSPTNPPQSHLIGVGDFTGDNKDDIVTANIIDNTLIILPGNGSGGFGSPINNPSIIVQGNMVAGDFNGDNKLDLAMTSFSANSVTVLLGDGTGRFPSSGSPFTINAPSQPVKGDFNGDNKLDLAVPIGSSVNSISILLGDGAGNFSAAAGSPYAVGNFSYFLAIGDFNGDNKLDLVIPNSNSYNAIPNNNINYLILLLGNGAGGFANAPNSPFATGNLPVAVAVGDFNGDGKSDVVTANELGFSANVFLGNAVSGLTNAPGSPYIMGFYPRSVEVADFNGDGKLDFAMANENEGTITLMLGDGAGNFTYAPSSPFPVSSWASSTARPHLIVKGDFNSDNKPDLVSANNDSTVVVFLNQPRTMGFFQLSGLASGLQAGNTASVTITAVDNCGQPNHNYTGTVTFSNTDTAAILPDDYTFLAGDNGVKTFNLTFNTGGNRTLYVTDTNDRTIIGSIARPITNFVVTINYDLGVWFNYAPMGTLTHALRNANDATGRYVRFKPGLIISVSYQIQDIPPGFTLDGGTCGTPPVTLDGYESTTLPDPQPPIDGLTLKGGVKIQNLKLQRFTNRQLVALDTPGVPQNIIKCVKLSKLLS